MTFTESIDAEIRAGVDPAHIANLLWRMRRAYPVFAARYYGPGF